MITDDIGIGYYTLLYNIELNLLSILKLITFPTSHFFTIVANKIRVVCTTIFLKASNIFIHFFSKIQIQIPPRFEKWIFPSYPPWTLIIFYLFFPKQVDNSFRLHPMTLCNRSKFKFRHVSRKILRPSYPPWTLIAEFYLFFPKQVDNSFREKWILHPSYPPWTLITEFYLFFPKQVDNSFRLHPMTLCFRSYPLNSNCDHPPWTKTPMLLACLKNVCKRHVQQSFSNACLYRISPISPRIYLTALLRPIKTDLQSRNRDST